MAVKNYVIDTNVLLIDNNAMYKFEENNVIIPIGVIEELDKFKKDQSELGQNARAVSRSLDLLRKSGDLRKGVPIGDGKLFVRYNGNLESLKKETNVDFHVLHIAKKIMEEDKGNPCIIVSRDINVRIRANALGIDAESYDSDKVEHHELDRGFDEGVLNDDDFNLFASGESIYLEKFYCKDKSPNYYYTIYNSADSNASLLGRIDTIGQKIHPLIGCSKDVGIFPKNREQRFLIDALMDDRIKLVSISGGAGTGKTLLSLAVGYYLAVKKRQHKRLLVSRPVIPMGKDIGFLPGTMEEKLDPWMNPIYDAFDVIKNNNGVNDRLRGRDMVDGINVVIEPLTYIRGRSIHDQFLIIDESQNLNAHEMKTIITRAGENTKIILTGDIYQIDNPYLDVFSNGLSIVSSKMKDSSLSAHIQLTKCVRSELAEEASQKL